jgi:hypothetical protein
MPWCSKLFGSLTFGTRIYKILIHKKDQFPQDSFIDILSNYLTLFFPATPVHHFSIVKRNMSQNTAIILIDPYKDFLHPQGKLYPGLAASLAENKTIEHFKQLVAVARARKIPIYYGLHQQHNASYAVGWKHITELQQMQIDSKSFEEGSWGVEFLEGLEPNVENGDVIVSKHWSSRQVAPRYQFERNLYE